MQYKISELITKFGGKLIGDDITIFGISPTDTAVEGQISYLVNSKYKKYLANSKASAIIIHEKDAIELGIPVIICDNPELYAAKVANLFHPRDQLTPKISANAIIDKTAVIGKNPAISHFVTIGKNVKIGDNCQIYPGSHIADNVTIGNNVIIFSNVSIYKNVKIGDDCIFHSGAVIGSDGFGNAKDKYGKWHRKPQIGGVIIGNSVDIGANTTVDCGTFSPTIIEDGVVIDNLVQIAHNVIVGAHTAIAACVGIAGSSKIGKYCMLGGGCGITGHIEIADYTVIGASTGISKSITKPDLYFGLYPFSTYKEYAKNAVHTRNLNDMYQRIKKLEQQLLQVNNNE